MIDDFQPWEIVAFLNFMLEKKPKTSTWQARMTPQAYYKFETMKKMVNVRPNEEIKGKKVIGSGLPTGQINIQKIRDWRRCKHDASGSKQTKNYTTPIKDQGECNACSSFAIIAAIESMFILQSCRASQNCDDTYQTLKSIDLSEANLFFDQSVHMERDQTGAYIPVLQSKWCGDYIDSNLVMDRAINVGACLERCHPYWISASNPSYPCQSIGNRSRLSKVNIDPNNSFPCKDETRIRIMQTPSPDSNGFPYTSVKYYITDNYQAMRWLWEKGPLVAMMYAPGELRYYGGGVYSERSWSSNSAMRFLDEFIERFLQSRIQNGMEMSELKRMLKEMIKQLKTALGYHVFCIVGFDDYEQCWIGKNSWGTCWGEEGWFRIKYGECGIGNTNQPFYAIEIDESSGFTRGQPISDPFSPADRYLSQF